MEHVNERRFSPEVRERAVWMVREHQGEYDSQYAAIRSVAEKIGCSPEALRGRCAAPRSTPAAATG